jgi:hypothetical protein
MTNREQHCFSLFVMAAKAAIQRFALHVDGRFRGHDMWGDIDLP